LTLIDGVRLLWLLAGAVALSFAVRKYQRAREDHQAHIERAGNGAVLHAGRWRIRSAQFAVAKSLLIIGAAIIATVDAFLEGPARLGLVVLTLLSLWPVVFAWGLYDDDHNHQLLLDLITTERPEREKRKMDEHIVSERVPEEQT
jgi:hypothetical protein